MDTENHQTWLVLRAQSGDREALEELLERVQQPLFRYLRHLTGNEDLAADLLQETFVRLYQKLTWLREPELFLAWAYRIASREAFRRLKVERQRPEWVPEPEILETLASHDPEAAPHQEWIAQVPELVASVSPASRAVLVLHYLEELPLREVGDVLGISLGTVKSRLSYGLNLLARRLQTQAPAR